MIVDHSTGMDGDKSPTRFIFSFSCFLPRKKNLEREEREREREMSKIISRSRNAGVFDLAKHFLSAVWAKTYGKVLLTSWVVNLIYLFSRRRRVRKRKKDTKKKDLKKRKNNDLYDIISLITMRKGFFTGRLFRYFVFYVLSLCTRVSVTV